MHELRGYFSASEVTTLWHFTNMLNIIIIIIAISYKIGPNISQ